VDYRPYLLEWRRRGERERARDGEAAQRAWSVARRLAHLLVADHGATRVVLVGSLARGGFKRGSDIDLAVAGLRPDIFFAVSAELERNAEGFAVDLVPLEAANPLFLEAVAREGVVLT
jgi:predicted nucleotidyltransferase